MKLKIKDVVVECKTSDHREAVTYSGNQKDIDALRFLLSFQRGYAGHGFDLDNAFALDILVACESLGTITNLVDPPSAPTYPDGAMT